MVPAVWRLCLWSLEALADYSNDFVILETSLPNKRDKLVRKYIWEIRKDIKNKANERTMKKEKQQSEENRNKYLFKMHQVQ